MNIKIKTRILDSIRPRQDQHGHLMEVSAVMLVADMKETIKEFLKVVPGQTWDAWCKEFNEEAGE